LGTDGVASNNSQDLFGEIKLAALLQKNLRSDPTALPAYQVLRMATANGAKAQGRPNSGCIRQGYEADLILLDFHSPRQCLTIDPMANLVYSCTGRDVAMTMCQGRILYENGEYKTIDIEKTMYEAKKVGKELGLV
jgi:5-methylthioadenosine/S-adenosylhomocysteine deaminase